MKSWFKFKQSLDYGQTGFYTEFIHQYLNIGIHDTRLVD